MKSFYEFYQKMLKEQAPMAPTSQPMAQPIQGGQTAPAVPPNPLSDPKVNQAWQLFYKALSTDPKLKPKLDDIQKTLTTNQPQAKPQAQAQQPQAQQPQAQQPQAQQPQAQAQQPQAR